MSSAKLKFIIVLPPILTVPPWSSRASAIILSKILKRVGEEQTSLAHSNCGSEPFSYVVVIVDCADRLVVEAFYSSDQVVIDAIQPHGFQKSCKPNSVERLLEVHENSKGFTGVAGILRLKICSVVLLPALKPACSSLMISPACGFSLFRRILSMT